MEKSRTFASIDDYIRQFTPEVQNILEAIRQIIKEAAPDATETISYQMPTFVLHGNLVHFAAFARHIGFYSLPSGHAAFQEELSAYKGGKGSVQFPLNKPMPYDLIRQIVQFRAAENKAKAESKKSKKKQK